MNYSTRKLIRRAICNVVISSIMLSLLYNGKTTTINAGTNYVTIQEQEVNSDDSEIDSKNSTVEIVSEDYLVASTNFVYVGDLDKEETVTVQESIVEEITEEETEDTTLVTMTSHSETVLSEVVLSEEEKITAITYCEPYTMYVDVNNILNVRTEAITGKDNVIAGLHYGDEVKVVGYNTYDQSWSAIEYRDKIVFVCNDYLKEWVDLSLRKDTSFINPEWDGSSILDSIIGKIQGPSGTETYYNLKMDKCIYYMNLLGYNYEVWVRDDGVKMFGDYIMVAANLDIRPKGSLVETSLGTGIVVDTGDFVNWDNTRVDIAVTW